MKKTLKTLLAVLLVAVLMASPVMASAYYQTGYNGYGNGYGYGYNYCTGMRTTYSDQEFNHDPWFDVYDEEYGVTFHLYPNMPIIRSDVFASVGKAMNRAYENANRSFSNTYGVMFTDFTWVPELYQVAGGLYQRGIMVGYPDKSVRLGNNITRGEFAKVVVLVAQQNGINVPYGNMQYEFPDMKGHWASKYASQCQALGLLVGRPNGFDPNANVTYQEFVTVMLRMSELAGSSYYSIDFEDVAYGISSTMDIDFDGYEYDGNADFDLSASGSKTINMSVGETRELKVKATPSDVELSRNDIEWETSKSGYLKLSNESIEDDRYATVQIKALKEGRVTVTATARDDEDVSVSYTVVISDDGDDEDVYVTSISVTPSEVDLGVGESKQITATVRPSNATDSDIIWKSYNTAVATVNQSGKITAVGVGNTTVTATAADSSGVVATIEVIVTAGNVTNDNVAPEVQITGANVIKRDEFVTLTVTAMDKNLASFELKKSDILGMTGAGVSVHKIEKVSDTEYKVTLLGVETSIGEVCIAAGVAVDTAGNKSAESDGVVIKVLAKD